jgi:hypothetical protein
MVQRFMHRLTPSRVTLSGPACSVLQRTAARASSAIGETQDYGCQACNPDRKALTHSNKSQEPLFQIDNCVPHVGIPGQRPSGDDPSCKGILNCSSEALALGSRRAGVAITAPNAGALLTGLAAALGLASRPLAALC